MRAVTGGIVFVVVLLLGAPFVFAYGGGGGGGGADDITAMVPTKPPQTSTIPAGFIPIPLDSIPTDTVFVDPENPDTKSAAQTEITIVSQDELGGDVLNIGDDAAALVDDLLRNPDVQTVVIIGGGIAIGFGTGGSSAMVQVMAGGSWSAATSYVQSKGSGSAAAYSGTKDAVIALIPVDPVSQAGISMVVDEFVEHPAQTIKAIVVDPFVPPGAQDFVRTGAEVLAEHPGILRDAAIRAVVPAIPYSPPSSYE